MRRSFVVLLIAMPSVKAQEPEDSASQVWTMRILLPLVALVWASVALSLFQPPRAPNRNQEQTQDTLTANLVYPLP
jgi:hypothetical protein